LVITLLLNSDWHQIIRAHFLDFLDFLDGSKSFGYRPHLVAGSNPAVPARERSAVW